MVLGSISVKEGETVNVGSLLGTVDNSGEVKDKNESSLVRLTIIVHQKRKKLKFSRKKRLLKNKQTKQKWKNSFTIR